MQTLDASSVVFSRASAAAPCLETTGRGRGFQDQCDRHPSETLTCVYGLPGIPRCTD